MIYVTGDTHGNHDFSKLTKFVMENKGLSRSDFVIIAGDFGGVWNAETLDKDLLPYKNLPFTVLFVDGNHENFDLLNSFPVDTWNCGKVHRISDNIIHLMRGQVFYIDGKSFFTFGGATSVDKENRIIGISWWEQEMPSYKEVDEGIENLNKVNNKVDYIITHTCDEKALYYYPLRSGYTKFNSFPDNLIMSFFEENVEYGHWYFGHYHVDGNLTDTKTVIYDSIIKLN